MNSIPVQDEMSLVRWHVLQIAGQQLNNKTNHPELSKESSG
jgi:hypothetical protein